MKKLLTKLSKDNKTELFEGNFCADNFYLLKNFSNPRLEYESKVEKIQFILLNQMSNGKIENSKINYFDEVIKLIAPTNFEWIDGILGLNINYQEYTRNFIYQMWLQDLINYPKITFMHTKRFEKSKFMLGDFSKDSNAVLSNYLNQIKYCESAQFGNGCSCELNHIRIKNRKVNLTSKVLVDTMNQYSIFPEHIYLNIIDYIIEEEQLKSREDCKLNEYMRLICKCDNPNLFPDINLNIENTYLNISLKDLYDFYHQHEFPCHFKILISKNIQNNIFDNSENSIVLGTEAIKNTLIAYDLEKRKMGFFQFSDADINPILKSIEDKNTRNNNIIIDGNFYVKMVSFLALIVIIKLLIELYKCSNSFRFANKDNKDKAELKNRNSLDYCELTDENYIYSNEKFKQRTQSRNIKPDFDSTFFIKNDKKINLRNQNKSYDFYRRANTNGESDRIKSRKDSFVSDKNTSQLI